MFVYLSLSPPLSFSLYPVHLKELSSPQLYSTISRSHRPVFIYFPFSVQQTQMAGLPWPAWVPSSSWVAVTYPAALRYGQSPYGRVNGEFGHNASQQLGSHDAQAAVDYGQSPNGGGNGAAGHDPPQQYSSSGAPSAVEYSGGHSQGGQGQTGSSHGRQHAPATRHGE